MFRAAFGRFSIYGAGAGACSYARSPSAALTSARRCFSSGAGSGAAASLASILPSSKQLVMAGCFGVLAYTAVASEKAQAERKPAATASSSSQKEFEEEFGAVHAPAAASASSQSQTIVNSLLQQASFGTLLGISAGYAIKKIGRAVALAVGIEILILQFAAFFGFIDINWARIRKVLDPTHRKKAKGARSDYRSLWSRFFHILLYRLPFGSAFTSGVYLGLKWG